MKDNMKKYPESNSICRGCQISFLNKTGVEGRYCSLVCKSENLRSKKKCKPECRPENLEVKTVVFKDGTQHSREACKKCIKSRYVSRCTPPVFEQIKTKDNQSISSSYR
jgi:hypothetical protein